MKTELVFLLDRSGSMSGLESDTIGGFNSMLERQKQESGDARVTTVLFDDRYELLHDRIDLQGIAPITQREYYVRGCTALLDAIGLTIEKIDRVQRNTAPELRADKVLFVITTDGLENASRRFRLPQIRAMIERHKEAFGWEFLFLGANIDAIATARQYGIGADRAVNYHADRRGTRINYEVLSRAASCIRANQPLGEDWKAEIEADYAARKPERR
jgi:hypothetical protein